MSKEMKTVVKVGMDSSGFNGSVTELNRKMKVLDAEFKNASEKAKAFGNSTDELRVKKEALTKKIELQSQKVNKLKDDYDKSVKEKGKDSKETENLSIKYNQAEQRLVSMQKALKDTTDKIKSQADKSQELSKRLNEISEKADQVSQKMNKAGDTLLKIGLPIVGLATVTGKFAMDFEDNMARVSTIIDETEVNMADLNKGVLNLSNQFGKSTKDISNALYEAYSAGVEASKGISFLDVATRNSIAGFTEITTSVDTLTNIMNAYGVETERALEISDKLLTLQNFGKTTIGKFGGEIGKVAPLAAQANVSIEELFGSIATLTKNSMGSSESLTAMKAILSNILKPSAQASEEASKLGLAFNASALQAKGFERFLDDVMRKTRGNTDSLVRLFGSVEALNAIMLLTSSKGSQDFKDALDAINNSTGATDSAMDKLDTTGQRFRQTLERVKNSATEMGASVLPILEKILNVLNPLTAIFAKLNPKVLQFVVIFGLVATIVGTVLKTISGTMSAVSNITKLMGSFNITTLKTVGIILAVVAALSILVGLILVMTGKTNEIERAMSSVGKGASDVMNNVPQPKSPNVPHYSRGGVHGGGWAITDEEGGELKFLPNRTVIVPHDLSKEMVKNGGLSGGGDTYYVTIDAKNVDEINKVVRAFKELKTTKRMGVST